MMHDVPGYALHESALQGGGTQQLGKPIIPQLRIASLPVRQVSQTASQERRQTRLATPPAGKQQLGRPLHKGWSDRCLWP